VPNLSKAKRVKEVVLKHVWLSDIKLFQASLTKDKLIFLARAFYSNRNKLTISAGSRHVL
jgi:hypothetical protein